MFFFFFNDTATTEIYTLSLHDALPICSRPDEHDVATGAAEIEKRLESLGVGWRGHPTKRLRILVAQWGALATREIHDAFGDRILLPAYRASKYARPDHPTHHLSGGHHEKRLLVPLRTAQHLRQLNVHRNRTPPSSA